MDKFDLGWLSTAVNYYDVQSTFYKGDGNELDFEEDILAKGLSEDDFPFTIDDFKKMGLGFDKTVLECSDGENDVHYTFDNTNDEITIETDEFTMKECFIIIDMINKQLMSEKAGSFVSFGDASEDTHVLFHEESTIFGMWLNDFIKLFQNRLKKKNKLTNKLTKVIIFREDYKTDDKRYHTKDRVIHIVLI